MSDTWARLRELLYPKLKSTDTIAIPGFSETSATVELYCSAEWHLLRLTGRGAPYVLPIYNIAHRLAKDSKVFSMKSTKLAEYFGVDDRTILRALWLLAASGFFEIVMEEPSKPVQYKPIRHDDWQKLHPGCCPEKLENPPEWKAERDPLGIKLHAISGGNFRPFPNFVKGMRNTGHCEEEIIRHFREFIGVRHPVGAQWNNRGLAGVFIKYLRAKPPVSPVPTDRACPVPWGSPDLSHGSPLVVDLSSRTSGDDTAGADAAARSTFLEEEDQSQKPLRTGSTDRTPTAVETHAEVEVQNPAPTPLQQSHAAVEQAFGKSALGVMLNELSAEYKVVIENVETWKRVLPEVLASFPGERPLFHRMVYVKQAFHRCLQKQPGTFPTTESFAKENDRYIVMLKQVDEQKAEREKAEQAPAKRKRPAAAASSRKLASANVRTMTQ